MIKLLIFLITFFVSFLDKPEKSTPALSERAKEQRAKWNIQIDQMDYPVSTLYLGQLQKMGVKIHHVSRWFNGATVEMDEQTAEKVAQLPFVTDVERTRDDSKSAISARKRQVPNAQITPSSIHARWTDPQLAVYNLHPLHQAGYEGQGILMTVCDGAFKNADTLSCFRHEQELGHFDFTDDADDFYGYTGAHGTECLSVISGIREGFYGAATKADYYLMRTEEYRTESPKEMDNLVAAFEKADSLGVNIFSVSLGYAIFDNADWDLDKYTDLDGKSTRVSRAATIAANKGMLVCVAAGNEGTAEWRTISAPADADSVLTIGAVTTDSVIGNFSSYGPSSDGRVKPEVCAVGVQATLINPGGVIVNSNGTSFATPLLAGMAAALWSALPDENAMQIRERIIRSAHMYPNADKQNQMGYGIPDAWMAYTMNITENMLLPDADDHSHVRKIIRGDQILIIRHGHIYNLAGQMIK